MKVYKVELMVLDFDEVGKEGIAEMIENQKYPNYCISPQVMGIDSRSIEWGDDHPLNKSDLQRLAFLRLFESEEEE